MYASGITYTGVASVSAAAGTITGADDGLSNSTVTPGNVVFGQNVNQVGDPAILLSNREIPGAGFVVELFNGKFIVSDVRTVGSGGRFEAHDTLTGVATRNMFNFIGDLIAVINNPAVVSVQVAAPTPVALTTQGTPMEVRVNGNLYVVAQLNGQFDLFNPNGGGAPVVNFSTIPLIGGALPNIATMRIGQIISPTIPFGIAGGIFIQDAFTAAGGTASYTGLLVSSTINQTAGGTGDIIGVDIELTITSNTARFFALRSNNGDVAFQQLNTVGRTSIRQGTPTAWLHIGGSNGAIASAPLKIDPGPLLAVPESGAFEFDNNQDNLYFTRVGTRESVFMGNDGAGAPTTALAGAVVNRYGGPTNFLGDPADWADLTINGATFKIPLYT